MQFLSLGLCLLIIRLASAAPLLDYGAPPAADTFSQYHSQDEHGQYAYGYTAPLYSKHEARTADGVTYGSYSYVDAAGKQQKVDYKADVTGFRILASSLQQQPNEETAEVASLRAQHLAVHAATKLRLAGGAADLPTPVQDTPEVAAAKVAFFKRYEAEKLRNQLTRATKTTKTNQLSSSTPVYVYQNGVVFRLAQVL